MPSTISSRHYGAVVVGAGPAGITVVGNLLERGVGDVLWVDSTFSAGRPNRVYREVSSNTRVSLFVAFAEATEPFRKVVETTPTPNAVSILKCLDQDRTCPLSHAADMCLMLSNGLVRREDVDQFVGEVTSADYEEGTSQWQVCIQSSQTSHPTNVVSDRFILCTGSSPASIPIPVPGLVLETIDLDVALCPSQLSAALSEEEEITMAVFGTSHSAVLVLMHLYRMAISTHPNMRIKWFTRNPLQFAQYMDGWILRDNTGLKGEAADWARANLEDDKFLLSPCSRYIQKIVAEFDGRRTYGAFLPECTHIIQAVGFVRDPIPLLERNGKTLDPVVYDAVSGGFTDEEGKKIKGLFGAGIAFPERVVDRAGNIESAVGFFKFMKYLKRVSGDWVTNE